MLIKMLIKMLIIPIVHIFINIDLNAYDIFDSKTKYFYQGLFKV